MMDIFIGNSSSNQVANDKKKRNIHKITMLKVCARMALGGFPHLWGFGGLLAGFWWTLHGVLMGF